MANNFCRYLSNGYRIETNGQQLFYRPCCWFDKSIDMVNDSNFIAIKKNISKISDWTPECQTCKKIEESGVKNPPRLQSFREIPNGTIPDDVPAWFELAIDTTCNAACLMCGPDSSTTWVKQEIKYNIKKAEDVPDPVDPLIWFEKIKNTLPLGYVNSISFLGGEPSKSKIPLKILQEIKKVKDLSTVSVHFQTNGSMVPSEQLIKLMSECRMVRYKISLDGIQKHLEYIRYPLKWKKIISTLQYVKGLQLPNLNFTVLNTINPLNVFYYDQVEQWADDFFEDCAPVELRTKPNRCEGNLDLAYTPQSLRQEIIGKFGLDHNVSKIFSNLEQYNDTDNLISFLNYWDSNRKTDWKKVFPEIKNHF